jgi:hypothetical protein
MILRQKIILTSFYSPLQFPQPNISFRFSFLFKSNAGWNHSISLEQNHFISFSVVSEPNTPHLWNRIIPFYSTSFQNQTHHGSTHIQSMHPYVSRSTEEYRWPFVQRRNERSDVVINPMVKWGWVCRQRKTASWGSSSAQAPSSGSRRSLRCCHLRRPLVAAAPLLQANLRKAISSATQNHIV